MNYLKVMFHSPSIHKLIPSPCFLTFSASPNYIYYSRLIVVNKNSVSFTNLKNVDVGHKFYCYLEQQEGISLKIMRPSVAKGYNRMYKEWKKSRFYLKDPIEFIIENALTILSKKMPKR